MSQTGANIVANVVANGRFFPIDLIVFDKDGTLIDFYYLWAAKAKTAVAALLAHLDPAWAGAADLESALYHSLGYDPATDRAVSDGPLATAALAKLGVITAVVLYQHGLGWHEAEQLAAAHFMPVITAPPTAAEVQPVGDVQRLCRNLHQAGIQIAILTSDDHRATEATLPLLGITDYVNAVIGGDDPFPNKPAPEALQHLSRALAVPPARMAMVGDNVSDLQSGRAAGVGCCIGVLSGTGQKEELDPYADVVINSVIEIQVDSNRQPVTGKSEISIQ
jgi:phosphoglycolate phosphatase